MITTKLGFGNCFKVTGYETRCNKPNEVTYFIPESKIQKICLTKNSEYPATSFVSITESGCKPIILNSAKIEDDSTVQTVLPEVKYLA